MLLAVSVLVLVLSRDVIFTLQVQSIYLSCHIEIFICFSRSLLVYVLVAKAAIIKMSHCRTEIVYNRFPQLT